MRGAQEECIFRNIDLEGNNHITDAGLVYGGPRTIAAPGSQNFTCGIKVPPNFVVSATLNIKSHYAIGLLGVTYSLTSISPTFKWVKTTDGGRWITETP
jgi:hypothetical protein